MILFLYNVTLKLYNAQIWVIVGVIYFDKSDINIYLYFQPHIINIYLYFQPQIQLQYCNDLISIYLNILRINKGRNFFTREIHFTEGIRDWFWKNNIPSEAGILFSPNQLRSCFTVQNFMRDSWGLSKHFCYFITTWQQSKI